MGAMREGEAADSLAIGEIEQSSDQSSAELPKEELSTAESAAPSMPADVEASSSVKAATLPGIGAGFDPVATLDVMDTSGEAASGTGSCPYPGLHPCLERTALVGRETDVEQVLTRLESSLLVAVVGPARVGKSSLLLAGVMPAMLERGDRAVRVMDLGETTDPDHSIADGLKWLSECGHPERVLVLDGAEALFVASTSDATAGTSQAVVSLRRLANFVERADPARAERILLGMRDSSLADCEVHEGFAEILSRGLYALCSLDRAHYRDVIRCPAQARGISVERSLLRSAAADAARLSNGLARLQHAMQQTWRCLGSGAELNAEMYDAVGGVEHALAHHAEEVLESGCAPVGSIEWNVAQKTFERLARACHSSATVGELAELCELAPGNSVLLSVLRRFANEGLLLLSGRDEPHQHSVVRLAEACLVDVWPRLRDWLRQDELDRRQYDTLADKAERYAEAPDVEPLLRAQQLEAAQNWWQAVRPNPAWVATPNAAAQERKQAALKLAGVERFISESAEAWGVEQAQREALQRELERERNAAHKLRNASTLTEKALLAKLRKARIGFSISLVGAAVLGFLLADVRGDLSVTQRALSASEEQNGAVELRKEALEASLREVTSERDASKRREAATDRRNRQLDVELEGANQRARQAQERNDALEERDRLLTFAHDRALNQAQEARQQQATAEKARLSAVMELQLAKQASLRAAAAENEARSSEAALMARVAELSGAERSARQCQSNLGVTVQRLLACEGDLAQSRTSPVSR